jgi:hypothetical protein
MTLTFYSYGVLMRRQTEDGGETEYPVSPAQLATSLAAKVRFETGLLTGDTLYIGAEGVTRLVVEYRPPQRTALFFDGAEAPLRVPLPGLVLVRLTTADDNPRYAVYAVKGRPTTLDTILYTAPLPNTDSRSICWGSVGKVSSNALVSNTLTEDWARLLGTVFTNHSVSGKSRSHPSDIRGKLVELEAKKARTYPLRDLVKTDLTLGKVIAKVQHDHFR